MADVLRLKKKAAEYEAKRQFERAIATYEQIARVIGNAVREADVPLFNRLGDLYLRVGDPERGVLMHEKAVDMYAELGFFNNAIALCNKILRQQPDRASVYYKLGKISAKKGFISDAKQNFLEYSGRMQKSGRMDEAFRALKEFADLCPGEDDVRLMLAEQLVRAERADEALEQLQLLHEQLVSEGRDAEAGATVERMRAIDPAVQPRRPSGPVKSMRDDLIFLDVNEELKTVARETAPVEGLEPTSLAEQVASGGMRILTPQEFGAQPLPQPVDPEREFQRPRGYLAGLPLIEDYDPRYLEEAAVAEVRTSGFETPTQPRDEAPADDVAEPADQVVEPAEQVVEAAEQIVEPAEQVAEPVDQVAEWPEQVAEPVGQIGELVEQTDEPVEQTDEPVEQIDDPEKQVDEWPVEATESGYFTADPTQDAVDSAEAAGQQYSAVDSDTDEDRTLDEAFEAAVAPAQTETHSLDEPAPAEPAAASEPLRARRTDDEYVDLGQWLREGETPRSMRMITDAGEIPPEGEQADFEEMLTKFKQGIAQNMDAEDYGSHFDLGIAFREMGLLDEAIAQFQKALRGREHRVATYELLGQCFVDKRQYEVAVTVLQRALREPGFEDERGLGVLYLLGFANERMVRYAEAARYYQRVFSVDIHFRDITDRISAVAQAAG